MMMMMMIKSTGQKKKDYRKATKTRRYYMTAMVATRKDTELIGGPHVKAVQS